MKYGLVMILALVGCGHERQAESLKNGFANMDGKDHFTCRYDKNVESEGIPLSQCYLLQMIFREHRMGLSDPKWDKDGTVVMYISTSNYHCRIEDGKYDQALICKPISGDPK